ncbi:DUF11 domain-containing protein, partial [Tenacibaculum geojense]
VASGGTLTLQYDVTVNAPSGVAGEYTNIAEVTGSDQYDPNSSPNNDDGDQSENDESSFTVTPQSSDLSLLKEVSNATPNVGDVVLFSITVSNSGPSNATGVSISDVLPVGYGSISNIDNGGVQAGNTITWSGLSVASSGSLVVSFEATVLAPTGVADEYVNSAWITGSD